jgi:hypothetical protein
VFGFLIVALAGAAAAFFLMNGAEQLGPATIASSSAPNSALPAPAQAAPSGAADVVATPSPAQQQLRIVAVKRGLIEVRSAAGDKYVRRYFEPGESYPVRVGYGWTVTAPEDGSAFEWRLGDQSLGLLTTEGPAYSQSVDLAAKRPVVEAPQPVVDVTETDQAAVATDPADPATAAAPTPRSASPVPSGPPGSRLATPPAASSSTPPKPKAPRPQPKPQGETQPPAVAANPPQTGQLPTAAPTTPAQDPALLAYPGQ